MQTLTEHVQLHHMSRSELTRITTTHITHAQMESKRKISSFFAASAPTDLSDDPTAKRMKYSVASSHQCTCLDTSLLSKTSADIDGEKAAAAVSSAPSSSRTAGGGDFARNDQYPLGRVNSHPRDKRLFMKESTHTYVIDGSSKHLTSVTTLLHDYFPHFDAVAISESIASRPWKKAEYRGKTAQQIRDDWEVNGSHQADLGTALHAQLEQYYNDLPVNADTQKTVEWAQFEDFHKREILSREWVMYHPEWIIFNEDVCLAGSIDAPFAAASNKHNEIILVDWKRTKAIDDGAFKNKMGFGPCRDIADSKTGHYGVQLNVYKWVLEQKYGVKVTGMYLAVFHPGQQILPDDLECAVGSDGKPCKYRFIEVKENAPLVEEIMGLRREAVAKLKQAERDEQDAVTNLIATRTVKRVLVCGDEAYADRDAVRRELEPLATMDDIHLVHGDCCGANRIAVELATKDLAWPQERVHANPTTANRDGEARNRDMVRDGDIDLVLVFHDKVWDCKYTRDMVAVAREAGIPVRVIGQE